MNQKQKENITYGIRKLAHLFRAIQAVDNGAAAGGIRVIDSVSRVIDFLFVEPKFVRYRESPLSTVSLCTVPGLVWVSNSTK